MKYDEHLMKFFKFPKTLTKWTDRQGDSYISPNCGMYKKVTCLPRPESYTYIFFFNIIFITQVCLYKNTYSLLIFFNSYWFTDTSSIETQVSPYSESFWHIFLKLQIKNTHLLIKWFTWFTTYLALTVTKWMH